MNQYFFVDDNNQSQGPFDAASMQGLITPDTYVFTKGMAEWTPAREVPELSFLFLPEVTGALTPEEMPQQQYYDAPVEAPQQYYAPPVNTPKQNNSTPLAATPQQAPQKSNKGLIIALSAIAAVAVIVAIVALMSKNKSDSSEVQTIELVSTEASAPATSASAEASIAAAPSGWKSISGTGSHSYSGKIGPYKIGMTLSVSDSGNVSGSYYYHKHPNSSMELEGTVNWDNDVLMMEEYDDRNGNTGHFTLRLVEGKVTGDFTAYHSGKSYHVTLE